MVAMRPPCVKRGLKKNHLFDDRFTHLSVDKLGNAGFSHEQLVFERGRGKAHKQASFIHVNFLRF